METIMTVGNRTIVLRSEGEDEDMEVWIDGEDFVGHTSDRMETYYALADQMLKGRI